MKKQSKQVVSTLPSVNDWLNSVSSLKTKKYMTTINSLADKLRNVNTAPTFKIRIIQLERLLSACHLKTKKMDNTDPLFEKINSLKTQAFTFLKLILDIKTDEELESKLAENQKTLKQSKKGNLIQHIPTTTTPKNLCTLAEEYKGEEKNGVKYLNKVARERYRLLINNGNFMQIVAKKEGDDRSLRLQFFDTFFMTSSYDHGCSTFVVRKNNIFAGITKPDKYHHSSLVAGKEVNCAGLMKTNYHGSPLKFTNESGHYRPTEVHMRWFLEYLSMRGALPHHVKIKLVSDRLKIFNRITNHIDIDEIQHSVRKNIHPQSCLDSFKQWRIASNAGLFAKRDSQLKKIDKYLLQYLQLYNIQLPQVNIQLLNEILACINQEKNENEKCQQAMDALALLLNKEISYWNKEMSINVKALDMAC